MRHGQFGGCLGLWWIWEGGLLKAALCAQGGYMVRALCWCLFVSGYHMCCPAPTPWPSSDENCSRKPCFVSLPRIVPASVFGRATERIAFVRRGSSRNRLRERGSSGVAEGLLQTRILQSTVAARGGCFEGQVTDTEMPTSHAVGRRHCSACSSTSVKGSGVPRRTGGFSWKILTAKVPKLKKRSSVLHHKGPIGGVQCAVQ